MNLLHPEDPRRGWEPFRRSVLWHVCRQENIPHEPGSSKNVMVALLTDRGVSPQKYAQFLVPDALRGNMAGRVEVKVPQEKREVDLNTLSVPALRKLAKEKGIAFEMTNKKHELISLIKG